MKEKILDDRNYTGITLLDGHIYMCVFNGDIYRMLDGIITATGQWSRQWTDIINYNNRLFACVYDGDIYEADRNGVFLALGQPSRKWVRLEIESGVLCAYDKNVAKYVYDGKDFNREYFKKVKFEGVVYNIYNRINY